MCLKRLELSSIQSTNGDPRSRHLGSVCAGASAEISASVEIADSASSNGSASSPAPAIAAATPARSRRLRASFSFPAYSSQLTDVEAAAPSRERYAPPPAASISPEALS